MTTINGIEIPCYGTLKEIHAALLKELNWTDGQVSINGFGYTVKEAGFQSNHSGRIVPWEGMEFQHPGMAILYNQVDPDPGFVHGTPFDERHMPAYFEIFSCGKVPHISKRCAECGVQLDQEHIRKGACESCYAEAVRG